MQRLGAVSILLVLAAGLIARIDLALAADPPSTTQPARPEGKAAPASSSSAPSVLVPEPSEDAAWQEVRAENSPEAYANFLYVYPNGRHGIEALRSLIRVADVGGDRATDVPFFGAVNPFRLDAFFALDAHRQAKPITVTEALLHFLRGKSLQVPLQTLAQDKDPGARLAAVELLFSLDEFWWLSVLQQADKSRIEQAVVSGLQSLLADRNLLAAVAAADALWQLRRDRRMEPLLACLKPGNAPAVRRAAADALGPIAGPTSIDVLGAAMQSDEDHVVRALAAESLGEIGDARAVAALVRALRADPQEDVRIAAAAALRILGDVQAIESLAAALASDKSPLVRWVAACALGTLGDARAAAPLTAALKDDDRSVRRAAAETLGAMREARAVEPLLAMLKAEKTGPLRSAAIDALGAIGDARAVEPLVDVIRQQSVVGDQPTSTSAALALRAIGDLRAVKLLFAAVDDRDPRVQSSAAFALGILDASPKVLATLAKQHRQRWYRHQGVWPGKRLFDPRTLHRLVEATAEPSAELRRSAAMALGMTADPRAFGPLVAVLKRDRDARVREATVRALGMCEEPRAVSPLLASLGDENPAVVLRAVEAVRDIKDPRVTDALLGALKRDRPSPRPPNPAPPAQEDPLATEESVRKAILSALAATGDSRSMTALVDALAHHSPHVRESAALGLGVLRDRGAVAPLLAALKDESSWVREKSAAALGLIGDPRAAAPLLGMLKDQAAEVRDAALRALALLGTPDLSPSLAEQLEKVANGSRYRQSYWTTMFALGWRPKTADDCVRLLTTQDQRVLLLAIWPSTKRILLPDATGGDVTTVERVGELFIALGRDEIVAELTALLRTRGTKNLATTFFHCGKKELQDASASWAQEHGKIQFPPRQAGADVQWGAM